MTAAPHQPLFEALVPGSSILSKVASEYFGLDVSKYLTILFILTGVTAALKYCRREFQVVLQAYFVSSVTVRQHDEAYDYVMNWVAKQPFAQRTGHVIATTDGKRGWWVKGQHNDDDEEYSVDDWLNRMEPRRQPLRYTPSHGMHFFRYKGHWLSFTRAEQDKGLFWGSPDERVHISCLGRDPTILKTLLEEAQTESLDKDKDRTVIYQAYKPEDRGGPIWQRCMARLSRPLSTVVLDDAQKIAILNDLDEYLSPLTKRWYSNRGIPYRRGYLLHGPPGTGKTSLCVSIAGLFRLKIYVLSLSSRTLSDDNLASLFHDLPRRCIVLLEDIDAAGLTKSRADDKDNNGDQESTQAPAPVMKGFGNPKATPGLSLSGLLNVIDGVASAEGRILVMTTNHLEKLDKALIRPGRIDMVINFDLANSNTTRDLFIAIYTKVDADLPSRAVAATFQKSKLQANNTAPPSTNPLPTSNAPHLNKPDVFTKAPRMIRTHKYSDDEITTMGAHFATLVPPHVFTPAEVQGYLLKHKYDPQQALDDAETWARTSQEEKRKAEEKRAAAGKKDDVKHSGEDAGKAAGIEKAEKPDEGAKEVSGTAEESKTE